MPGDPTQIAGGRPGVRPGGPGRHRPVTLAGGQSLLPRRRRALRKDSAVIDVRRVAGNIGAEIYGVDLSRALPTETVSAIRTALLAHKVLFFRDQTLDHAAHIAFARNFGLLTYAHPYHKPAAEEFPEILTIDPRPLEDEFGRDHEEVYRRRRRAHYSGWHTDVSPAVNPPAAGILRAAVVPEYGGDTQWTNLAAAYAGLSDPIKSLADTLHAEHRFLSGFQMLPGDPEVEALVKMTESDPLIAIHPVVRVHPETGEKVLFVNPSSVARIMGLTTVESEHLLRLFHEQLVRPEYTVRFRWEPGSVAFWDNRATAHLAAEDTARIPARRTLYRVTLLGDRPKGPDGFESELVSGRPFAALREGAPVR
ncbi:TauD/TfdA family dioxygenase [Microbispora tritici]|uniref:TauD/TfdA family dioxygenase n=2 Tax=Microbispora TaxID=2005 RepID=A0ABY3LMR8_9ACTN|nr:TauD/TfdA family dioxygenase [Microbispora fusca]TYB43157.1 TauD/TfdA family dioxygenase [Microbispora tritici]